MSGSIGYQIFLLEQEWDDHETRIKTLLNIPQRGCCGYREKLKSYTEEKWCGTVTQMLVDVCASMSPAERLLYYDENNLVTPEYLNENGWFPPT